MLFRSPLVDEMWRWEGTDHQREKLPVCSGNMFAFWKTLRSCPDPVLVMEMKCHAMASKWSHYAPNSWSGILQCHSSLSASSSATQEGSHRVWAYRRVSGNFRTSNSFTKLGLEGKTLTSPTQMPVESALNKTKQTVSHTSPWTLWELPWARLNDETDIADVWVFGRLK